MCDICDLVRPGLDVNEKSELLRLIGHQIAACEPCADHFKASLDILLDTVLEERDPLIEAYWEEDRLNLKTNGE